MKLIYACMYLRMREAALQEDIKTAKSCASLDLFAAINLALCTLSDLPNQLTVSNMSALFQRVRTVVIAHAHLVSEANMLPAALLDPHRIIFFGDHKRAPMYPLYSWGGQAGTGCVTSSDKRNISHDESVLRWDIVKSRGNPGPVSVFHRIATAWKQISRPLPMLREQSIYHPKIATWLSKNYYSCLIRTNTFVSGVRTEDDHVGLWWLDSKRTDSLDTNESEGMKTNEVIECCIEILSIESYTGKSALLICLSEEQVSDQGKNIS